MFFYFIYSQLLNNTAECLNLKKIMFLTFKAYNKERGGKTQVFFSVV